MKLRALVLASLALLLAQGVGFAQTSGTFTVDNPGAETLVDFPVLVPSQTRAAIVGACGGNGFGLEIAGQPAAFCFEQPNGECSAAPSPGALWVRVPSLPAGGRVSVVARCAATSAAQGGEAVFDFYEDFSGSALDPLKWRLTDYNGDLLMSMSGGHLRYRFSRNACCGHFNPRHHVAISDRVAYENRILAEGRSPYWVDVVRMYMDGGHGEAIIALSNDHLYQHPCNRCGNPGGGCGFTGTGVSVSPGTWHTYRFDKYADFGLRAFVDGRQIWDRNYICHATTGFNPSMSTRTSDYWTRLDWTRIRKTASVLPVVGGFEADADADGVPDAVDALPCDASAVAVAFAPAEGQTALLLAEDQWPRQGDIDFNDLAVAHHHQVRLDAQGRARSVLAVYDVLALGGVFTNGLGLHLPAPRSAVGAVTLRVNGGAAQALTPSSADEELTVVLASDLRALFGGAAGQINSRPDLPRVAAPRLTVEVTFPAGVDLPASGAPWDVFLFRSDDPSHEIHRPAYGGTASMQTALFGTGDDASAPGRSFVDASGLPFFLSLPASTPYPAEGAAISWLFPDILGFASSGGTTHQDFYTRSVPAHAYVDSAGAGPAAPGGTSHPVDVSCVGSP